VLADGVGSHPRRYLVAIGLAIGQRGLVAPEPPATNGKTKQILHQRTVEMEIGAMQVAEFGVFLHGGFKAGGTSPARAHLAGDDVDPAAHRARPVAGRHRWTDDLAPFGGGYRREEVVGGVAEVVRRDVTAGVLAAGVDQYQRV